MLEPLDVVLVDIVADINLGKSVFLGNFIVGIILGDVVLGLKVGALIELAFAGLTPAGGTQPPNPVFAGLMGTVLAYTTGCQPSAALGLCLPFSFLGQYLILFYYSAFSFFMGKADKAASEADTSTITKINLTTMAIVSGVVAFLCTYVAQEPMKMFVNSLPEVITHGLEVAGGILPAVGFGMLLRVMMKTKYTPYFIAGFLMASFCDMPNLLPVALLGTVFALIDFFGAKQRKQDIEEALQNASIDSFGGDDNVGI